MKPLLEFFYFGYHLALVIGRREMRVDSLEWKKPRILKLKSWQITISCSLLSFFNFNSYSTILTLSWWMCFQFYRIHHGNHWQSQERVHKFPHYIYSLACIYTLILSFERERERTKEREHEWVGVGKGAREKGERQRERESQAHSTLSAKPNVGLDLTTLRSWPMPESRVWHLIDWITQAPLNPYILFSLLLLQMRCLCS